MAMPGAKHLMVGIREIDAGTEGLCYVMGRLFDPMVECRRAHGGCDRRDCTRIAAIARYLNRNFARQEQLMETAGYPMGDHHRREHWKLLDQLSHMQASEVCADRDRKVVSEVVARWTTEHIPQCDQMLGNWAVTRRVLDPA